MTVPQKNLPRILSPTGTEYVNNITYVILGQTLIANEMSLFTLKILINPNRAEGCFD